MTVGFLWPAFIEPPRRGEDPRKDAGRARTRFLLRVAALHASEEGTVSALSAQLGLARATLANYAARGDALTPELARRVETASGGVCRAFYFRPDVFTPSEHTR